MLIQEERDEIREIIADAIAIALSKQQSLPICAIESQRLQTIEGVLSKLTKFITGNGTVESGILWKVDSNTQQIRECLEMIKKLSAAPVKKDKLEILVDYLVNKVLPTLLTAAILAWIATQIALGELLKVP
jgi:hypothetical protein